MPSNACGAARTASSSRPSPAAASRRFLSSLLGGLRRAVDAILALALAPRCAACGGLLACPTDGPVCASCWTSIAPLPPPLCDRCGEPVASRRAASAAPGGCVEVRCPACRHLATELVLCRSAGEYEGALRQIVHALKYEGRRTLARPLAALMRDRGEAAIAGADVAVPVPLHWRRHLVRGFNQADDLARALGLPVVAALRRSRATRPQVGLRPGARARNVSDAFRPSRGWLGRLPARVRRIRGARVLLVDDVTTTGATLRECAEVLMRLGARDVRGITAARARRRRAG